MALLKVTAIYIKVSNTSDFFNRPCELTAYQEFPEDLPIYSSGISIDNTRELANVWRTRINMEIDATDRVSKLLSM